MDEVSFNDMIIIKQIICDSFELDNTNDVSFAAISNDIMSFSIKKDMDDNVDDMINNFKKVNKATSYNRLRFKNVTKEIRSATKSVGLSVYYIDPKGKKFQNMNITPTGGASPRSYPSSDSLVSVVFGLIIYWTVYVFHRILSLFRSCKKGMIIEKTNLTPKIIIGASFMLLLCVVWTIPCYFSQIPGSCISNFRLNLLAFVRNVRK